MSCYQSPSTLASALPQLHALSPDARRWVTHLLTARGTLADVAAAANTDLVTFAERMLRPDIQAALAAIEHISAQLARVRALIARPAALDTIAGAAANPSASPVERRRAATTLLRAGNPPAPNRRDPAHAPATTPQHVPTAQPAAPAGPIARTQEPAPDPAPANAGLHAPNPALQTAPHARDRPARRAA